MMIFSPLLEKMFANRGYTESFLTTYEQYDPSEQMLNARAFCERINAGLTRYMRKNKPAHFTPWSSQDGKENLFVCWYYV